MPQGRVRAPRSENQTAVPDVFVRAQDATNSTTTTDIATVASTTSETLPPPTSTTTVAATTTAEFTTTMEENATSPTAGATTSTTVSTTTTVPPRKRIICVFVADAYNFGKNSTPYIQERYLIGNMSDYFFKSTVEPKAGIAKYGYVKSFSVSTALSALKDRQEDFFKVIDTDPEDISALPFDTADAIKRINRFDNVKGRANSLIFISAQKDTEKLPKLQPKSKEWERIVAVGFDDTDLTNVTDKDRGVVVSIPYNFSEDDVKKVIDALLEGFHTSTTTLAPTAAAEAPAQSSPVPIDTSTGEFFFTPGLSLLSGRIHQ
ncbi:hypothetical protein Y032_0470g2028 [Ancylostoma ceylanicum]|uniref:Uncharacterized protein n=1 Tax=Ancylostoma ceylanicum TaxID=53326 RepID=A0A016WX39_9BILA|nr:hypothetical protein Y032_0470g2028 [Ancylostoma ceylanicum]